MSWFLMDVAPWILGIGVGIYWGFLVSRGRNLWR
jgi:hypothetical protein